MEKAIYKKVKTKACNGPGGMRCPCCRCGNIAIAKRKNNRILRRSKAIKEIFDDSRAG